MPREKVECKICGTVIVKPCKTVTIGNTTHIITKRTDCPLTVRHKIVGGSRLYCSELDVGVMDFGSYTVHRSCPLEDAHDDVAEDAIYEKYWGRFSEIE